jgi:aminoglycoside phosphotransferase (APT) family kinase protein
VHALLRHLERAGYAGAPRVLGVDDDGREVLSLIEGHVPASDGLAELPDASLEQVARLLRELHEATAGFVLPEGVEWAARFDGDEAATVICHNDVAPRNTVFRDGRPVAFIDWDLACPAPPAWDLAHAAWQFVPLMDDEGCRRRGWSRPPDRPGRLRRLVDAYDPPPAARRSLVALAQRRMLRSARGIEELAAAGAPAFQRLLRDGVPDAIRREAAWTARHRTLLTEAVRRRRP